VMLWPDSWIITLDRRDRPKTEGLAGELPPEPGDCVAGASGRGAFVPIPVRRPHIQNETGGGLGIHVHRPPDVGFPLPFDRPPGEAPGPRLDGKQVFLLCDLGHRDEGSPAVTDISPGVARSARRADTACHWFGWDMNGLGDLGDRMGRPAGETLVMAALGEEMVTLVTL
jgi:hypothetical protein